MHIIEELCQTLDGPFREPNDATEEGDEELAVGPALLVREQRVRAARLYDNVGTWSLWYAHADRMPAEGWVVDVETCECDCTFYSKFKTSCYIVVKRQAEGKAYGGGGSPGVEDKTEKLFNPQVRKRKKLRK